MFALLTSEDFFTFICIETREKSFFFSDSGFCDRYIIFRSQLNFVFCFLCCTKLTAGGEARVRILAIDSVCIFHFLPFLFFPIFQHF